MIAGSNKYFKKLVLFALLIGAIPVIVVGVLSYYKSSDIIQQKVNDANMQLLQQTQMTVEQLLKTQDRNMVYCVDTPAVNKAMATRLSIYDFQLIEEIRYGLLKLQSFDMGVKDAFIVNCRENWVINNDRFLAFDEFEEKDKLLRYLKMQKPSFWIFEDSGHDLTLVRKLPINSLDATGAIVIKTTGEHISKLLSNSSHLGEVMIIDESFRILACDNNQSIGKDLSSTGITGSFANNWFDPGQPAAGNLIVLQNENRVCVSFLRSDYNQWVYLSVTSISQTTRDSKFIGWITFYVCIVTIITICIIALFGSIRMYNPIRRIYESLLNLSGADNARKGSDELVIISERVKWLMKNQSRLITQINSNLQQLKEFFVLKLIQGEVNEKELMDKLNLYGYSCLARWMCVMVLQIDTFEGTRYEEKDKDLMMFSINNIIGELLEKIILLHPIVTKHSQVTVIGGEQGTYEEFKNFVYFNAEKIQKTIAHYIELQVSIGISRPFHKFSEVHQAFREGVEALKYRIKLGYNSILFIEDVLPEHTMHIVLPVKIENELISAVKSADEEKASGLLHQYIEFVFKSELNHDEYHIPLVRLLTDLINILQETRASYKSIYNGEKPIFAQLFELKTVHEIEAWFKNAIIKPVIDLIEEKNVKHHKNIIDSVMKMVENEFDTDLTLEECASRMNYHPSYIRRVLRKDAGINFSDCLSSYRIEKTKKLLSETDMKISDIAAMLQYNNSQNFIRHFRKITGITPGQYRKENGGMTE